LSHRFLKERTTAAPKLAMLMYPVTIATFVLKVEGFSRRSHLTPTDDTNSSKKILLPVKPLASEIAALNHKLA
jgi:hypothetical protein